MIEKINAIFMDMQTNIENLRRQVEHSHLRNLQEENGHGDPGVGPTKRANVLKYEINELLESVWGITQSGVLERKSTQELSRLVALLEGMKQMLLSVEATT